MGKIEKLIDEVVETMCTEYCKYPENWKPEEHDDQELFESDICLNCPLNKL